MAKQFTMKARDLNNLYSVISMVSKQELAKVKAGEEMKAIIRHEKLCRELDDQNEPYSDFLESKFNKPLKEYCKPYFDRAEAVMKDQTLSSEEKRLNIEEIDNEMRPVRNLKEQELSKELNLEEEAVKEVNVKITSEERYELLKFLMEKIIWDKFEIQNNPALSRKLYVEAVEIIESAKEL